VAAEDSTYPNKGFVTHHMRPEHLHDGLVDIYLCGPPPMVDAVRKYLADQGIQPASFYYEKFSGSGVVSEIGESHVKAVDSDAAFDTRMALELGAAQLVVGTLSAEQLAEYRRLAEATGQYIKDGHFTDPAGFRETNSAFHLFPIEATGNPVLIEAYRKLLVQEYMGQVLTPSVDLVGDITKDHIDIVTAFEQADFEGLRRVMSEHNDHAKATMRAGIEKPG
jgi:benzoate/toluate 1,2-dioxygenase reductase subunit